MTYSKLGLNTGYDVKTTIPAQTDDYADKITYSHLETEYKNNTFGEPSKITTYTTDDEFNIKHHAINGQVVDYTEKEITERTKEDLKLILQKRTALELEEPTREPERTPEDYIRKYKEPTPQITETTAKVNRI